MFWFSVFEHLLTPFIIVIMYIYVLVSYNAIVLGGIHVYH